MRVGTIIREIRCSDSVKLTSVLTLLLLLRFIDLVNYLPTELRK